MSNKIVYNYIVDQCKKDIGKFERANIITKYMKDCKLSTRALALQLGIPKSTINNWCLFNRLNEEEYKDLKEKGCSDAHIYRMLREDCKTMSKDLCNLDAYLSKITKELRGFIHVDKRTPQTKVLIQDLTQVLNRLLIEKRFSGVSVKPGQKKE